MSYGQPVYVMTPFGPALAFVENRQPSMNALVGALDDLVNILPRVLPPRQAPSPYVPPPINQLTYPPESRPSFSRQVRVESESLEFLNVNVRGKKSTLYCDVNRVNVADIFVHINNEHPSFGDCFDGCVLMVDNVMLTDNNARALLKNRGTVIAFK